MGYEKIFNPVETSWELILGWDGGRSLNKYLYVQRHLLQCHLNCKTLKITYKSKNRGIV